MLSPASQLSRPAFAFALPFCAAVAVCAALPAAAQRVVNTAPLTITNAPPQATPELVMQVHGPMPTGIAVSHEGRMFLCYPRWTSQYPYTLAEIKNGQAVPYPDAEYNTPNRKYPAEGLVSVQNMVIDPLDRLWVLDTGSVKFGPTMKGGPKLIGFDLKTNKVVNQISFPRGVVLSTSYLNDVRFDLTRGKAGLAYITDSAQSGTRAIVVVDLATGKSWRRLAYDPSTEPDPDFTAVVDGQPLLTRQPNSPPRHLTLGADGLALSSDGKTIYYCPLASHHLYSVDAAAVGNRLVSDKDVRATVKDLGTKPMSDGLGFDSQGNLYLTDEEAHRILYGPPASPYAVLAVSPNPTDWVDTMALATDGYLYYTANQLELMPQFNDGVDKRTQTYSVYRVKVSGTPVELK